MHIERLVEMINDIAANQAADPDNAVDTITQHLRRFWDPRMRAQIVAHAAAGGDGLSDFARQAVARLSEQPASL